MFVFMGSPPKTTYIPSPSLPIYPTIHPPSFFSFPPLQPQSIHKKPPPPFPSLTPQPTGNSPLPPLRTGSEVATLENEIRNPMHVVND